MTLASTNAQASEFCMCVTYPRSPWQVLVGRIQDESEVVTEGWAQYCRGKEPCIYKLSNFSAEKTESAHKYASTPAEGSKQRRVLHWEAQYTHCCGSYGSVEFWAPQRNPAKSQELIAQLNFFRVPRKYLTRGNRLPKKENKLVNKTNDNQVWSFQNNGCVIKSLRELTQEC